MKKEIVKKEKNLKFGESDLKLVQSDVPISPEIKEKIQRFTEIYGIPPFGLTVLGGRLYVNVSGLDFKLRELEKQGKKVKRIDYEIIQRPDEKNGYLAGVRGIIEFEDEPEREKLRVEVVKKAIEQGKSPEEIEKILEKTGLTPPIFVDEGWTSPKTCPAIAYLYQYDKEQGKKVPKDVLVENVMMMAIRKATNRAKRLAVGCGLTSVDEVEYTEKKVIDMPSEPEKPDLDAESIFGNKNERGKK